MTGSTPGKTPSAGFPFESRYVTVDGHRIHYVEDGRGAPILFIHGNPTWAYVWRNILPTVARQSGRRGIALDLLGFGRSDKPRVQYSVRLHYRIVEGFIERLDLRDLILVLHDWGGPLGAYYALRHPESVQALAFMETAIWNLTWADFRTDHRDYTLLFKLFRSPVGYVMIQVLNLFVNQLLPGAVVNRHHLTEEVMRRYREPFPTVASRRAIRVFPTLLPVEGKPRESREFFQQIEAGLASMRHPVLWIKATPGLVSPEQRILSVKQKLPQLEVNDFGPGLHYLQEEDPERIARLLVDWIRKHKLGR